MPAEARELLIEMTQLVGPNLVAECGDQVTVMADTPVIVYISVKTPITVLDWDTDEQYMLDVQSKGKFSNLHLRVDTSLGQPKEIFGFGLKFIYLHERRSIGTGTLLACDCDERRLQT